MRSKLARWGVHAACRGEGRPGLNTFGRGLEEQPPRQCGDQESHEYAYLFGGAQVSAAGRRRLQAARLAAAGNYTASSNRYYVGNSLLKVTGNTTTAEQCAAACGRANGTCTFYSFCPNSAGSG